MADEHDHDVAPDVPMEDRIDDLETPSPIETALSISTGDLKREVVPLLGGGVVLLSALRSLGRGQLRAVPKGIVGAGLLGYALRNRASSDSSTFEPTLDEIDGGTEGKEVSDQAHAAAERLDAGRESQIDAGGEIDDSAQLGDERDEGSRIEFTDDATQEEPRSKPDVDGADDPRRDTDDESVEIDVSDSAMAEEVSEATGPDPEQAQPTQTDAIEPEETPEEDASDMKVEPDEDSETAAESRDESDDDESAEDDGQ
ncbi:hypothetical protein [Natronorubrum aibiense]|uniref:Uncharacterized protein n=1 Tax=Natronorubrum aibiense TaxID=348826 RepID=A0A5P9P3T9_9EURY|nr:hypothetical protein [Natronorubrum aibiense]QFU82637.1 hypothetical protein GCU68_08935 [Natronorubrum aibiense]